MGQHDLYFIIKVRRDARALLFCCWDEICRSPEAMFWTFQVTQCCVEVKISCDYLKSHPAEFKHCASLLISSRACLCSKFPQHCMVCTHARELKQKTIFYSRYVRLCDTLAMTYKIQNLQFEFPQLNNAINARLDFAIDTIKCHINSRITLKCRGIDRAPQQWQIDDLSKFRHQIALIYY